MRTGTLPASAALFFFIPAALALASGACSAKGTALEADYATPYQGQGVMSRNAVWEGAGYNPGQRARAAEPDAGGPALPGAGAAPEASRKLVYRASLSVRVQDPEKAGKALEVLMEQHGAYASSVNIRENSRHYTIRVPAAAYPALLSALDGMGRRIHRSESAEDVTLQYYDLEGRLSTKRELLKTYRSYLGRAKNIEELLSVEAKIAELEDDIDGTGKELRTLAGLVDHATVELEIQGPENTPSYAAPTLGDRLSGLFGAFGEFLSTILVILLGIAVYGIPSLLILALLFWILFGRIGLLKKLLFLTAGKKDRPLKADALKGKKPERA
jgi:hypothetical protein